MSMIVGTFNAQGRDRVITQEELQAARRRLMDGARRRPRAGAVWLVEGVGPDRELIKRPAYFAPGTPYGLSVQQVLDLPVSLQADVLEAWVRANFESAPPEVQVNVGAHPIFWIRERIDLEFHDARIGGSGPAIQEAANRLGYPVWFLRDPDPEMLRSDALKNLQEFEDALRQLPAPAISNLHNNPPEPVDDSPLSSAAVDRILAAIAETRQALLSQELDIPTIQAKTEDILGWASATVGWLARLGDTAAMNFAEAFGKAAGKALGTPIGAAMASYLLMEAPTYLLMEAPTVVSKALHAVAALQHLLPN